jgi:ribosome-associated translation inhibitor RaiA
MTQALSVVIRFKDVENDDEVRDLLDERCRRLSSEFPETTRYELTIGQSSTELDAHAHVTGKGLDAAAQAAGADARQAGERALDKLERELRRVHDKRIFSRRREAQRGSPKRNP